MTEWKRLSADKARIIAGEWEENPDFESYLSELRISFNTRSPSHDRTIHNRLVEIYSDIPRSGSSTYIPDLEFALRSYFFFVEDLKMTPSLAADDDVWRYIQMKVCPDLIYERWGPESDKKINNARFWKDPRRIWLKSLWWYVHLSLQNNSMDDTRAILIDNTSDEISQLVERPGSGYRVDLCRAIMLRYSRSPKHHRDLLRNIMKLNTVRCMTVEPLLFDSGIEGYVEELFRYYDA